MTKLDRISFRKWLDLNGLNSERLIWYCDYSCRDDYGLSLDQTSAWAGLFYFCARVKKGGEESQPYVAFPEGNGHFVRHIAGYAKGKIKSSRIVVELIPGESGIELLCFDPSEKKLTKYLADKVIYSAPLFTAPFIIQGFSEQPAFDPKAFSNITLGLSPISS